MTRGPSEINRRQQVGEVLSVEGCLPIEPLSVRIAMAVKLTGIGRSTLCELINSGEIETVKIGRSTFIAYRCLKRLVEG